MANIKLPSGETAWVTYFNSNGTALYIVTSKPSREFYFLYEILEEETVKKLGKAHSPKELEDKFNILSKIAK